VIYLDTSVALAQLFAEDIRPADALWHETLISSRLLQYELWTRIHSRGLASTHGDAAHALLGRIGFIELLPAILTRALDPFPLPVRTLDALHLAALEFLRAQGQTIELASYDQRMLAVARAMNIPVFDLTAQA
jgi:hypothetical protein